MLTEQVKHEEKSSGGAPAWMVTYGDMMSLLLCFFIMLVAMSEVKSEKFKRALESIRSAFGTSRRTITTVPGSHPTANSFEEQFRIVVSPHGDPQNMGGAETANLRGNEYLCRTVSEGLMITFGLAAPFERGSAELNEKLKGELSDLVEHVRGHTNRIIVRGHCSSDELDLPDIDKWKLGFARARAVAEGLMSMDISERRLRLASLANTQPLKSNLTPQGRSSNRRIEVIVTRQTVAAER